VAEINDTGIAINDKIYNNCNPYSIAIFVAEMAIAHKPAT
jgi:hypothetical protein